MLTDAKFNNREIDFVAQINNFVNGNPATDVTSTGDLAIAKSVSNSLHLMAFNFEKAMSMAEPPPFLERRQPTLENFPALQAQLLQIKKVHRGVV